MADPTPARRRTVAVAVAALLIAGACGDDDDAGSGQFVALDGSPRPPDQAGVLTGIAADNSTITVDGDHVYELHDELQSFSSVDGTTQPLRSRLGQYVHIGLDGDTALWVAGIGAVSRIEGQPQTVAYLGTIASVDGRTITMVDGAVFELADDVEPPEDVPVEAVLRVGVTPDEVVQLDIAGPPASVREDG